MREVSGKNNRKLGLSSQATPGQNYWESREKRSKKQGFLAKDQKKQGDPIQNNKAKEEEEEGGGGGGGGGGEKKKKKKEISGFYMFAEVFRCFQRFFQRSSQRPSQRQIALSQALSPVAPNRVAP